MQAVFLGLLFLSIYVFRDLVLVLLTAVVFASAVEPATRWFGRRGIPRIPAVLIIYTGALLTLIGLFYALIPPFLEDAVGLIRLLPQYIDPEILGYSTNNEVVGEAQHLSETASLGALITGLHEFISGNSGGFLGVLSAVFGGILSAVLIFVFSIYLSVQEDGVANFLRVVTPARHEAYVIHLWRRTQHKIGRWMQGQLLLGVAVGVMVYIALLVLGVRYALLLAILAAVFEIIPIFGPILAAIPAIAVAFADGGIVAALIVAGLYTLIQQLENHLLYPMVVRKVVGVPPFLVIIALFVGARLAGFLGILLSVPVAAALREYVGDWERKKREEQEPLAIAVAE